MSELCARILASIFDTNLLLHSYELDLLVAMQFLSRPMFPS